MAMFTHVTVGTNDLAKARSFYDGVLEPLGYKRLNDLGDNGSASSGWSHAFLTSKNHHLYPDTPTARSRTCDRTLMQL